MSITDTLVEDLTGLFGDKIGTPRVACKEVTIDVSRDNMQDVMRTLCNDARMSFETLMDLCGVDYSTYGLAEWQTEQASSTGFSRGVDASTMTPNTDEPKRFAVIYHLLSIKYNRRLRVRVLIEDNDFPVVDSVDDIWSSANWYEREAFDLYGIIFEGHPDLRRLLTDYGFIGHPFRKDFPLSGQVEMIYDEEQKRVVYQPVSIEPRVLVPRVVRHDHRFETAETGESEDA